MHSVFGKINYGDLKPNSVYLGLVLPSGGCQSLIRLRFIYTCDVGPVILLSDAISIENFLSPQIDRPLSMVILVRIVYFKIASLSKIAKPTSPVDMSL